MQRRRLDELQFPAGLQQSGRMCGLHPISVVALPGVNIRTNREKHEAALSAAASPGGACLRKRRNRLVVSAFGRQH